MAALPLVLASGSPRRRDLLARAGVAFEIHPSHIPEERRAGEAPAAFAARLAEEKARSVAEALGAEPPRQVLGADTIVVIDDDVLGKPRDAEHAVALLTQLQGRTHRVVTAVCVVSSAGGAAQALTVESRVTMHPNDRAALEAYVATGESLDKAGAYAVQGEGRHLVAKVEGSETNVIGLPMEETLALLAQVGIEAGG